MANAAGALRLIYAYGWVIGVAFGSSLIRAVVSGGDWWIFPPVLLALSVAWPLLRIRKKSKTKAELR